MDEKSFVISTWLDTRDGERQMRMVPVADQDRAAELAGKYRDMSNGSSMKVDKIVLVRGIEL